MADEELEVGAFYWVALNTPSIDHPCNPDFWCRDMPARFCGYHRDQRVWNLLGENGEGMWSVAWVGPKITSPREPENKPAWTKPQAEEKPAIPMFAIAHTTAAPARHSNPAIALLDAMADAFVATSQVRPWDNQRMLCASRMHPEIYASVMAFAACDRLLPMAVTRQSIHRFDDMVLGWARELVAHGFIQWPGVMEIYDIAAQMMRPAFDSAHRRAD